MSASILGFLVGFWPQHRRRFEAAMSSMDDLDDVKRACESGEE